MILCYYYNILSPKLQAVYNIFLDFSLIFPFFSRLPTFVYAEIV